MRLLMVLLSRLLGMLRGVLSAPPLAPVRVRSPRTEPTESHAQRVRSLGDPIGNRPSDLDLSLWFRPLEEAAPWFGGIARWLIAEAPPRTPFATSRDRVAGPVAVAAWSFSPCWFDRWIGRPIFGYDFFGGQVGDFGLFARENFSRRNSALESARWAWAISRRRGERRGSRGSDFGKKSGDRGA